MAYLLSALNKYTKVDCDIHVNLDSIPLSSEENVLVIKTWSTLVNTLRKCIHLWHLILIPSLQLLNIFLFFLFIHCILQYVDFKTEIKKTLKFVNQSFIALNT